MKTKPIEWRKDASHIPAMNATNAYSGTVKVGRICCNAHAYDLFGNLAKEKLKEPEARAWVEKQFTDFITSITT